MWRKSAKRLNLSQVVHLHRTTVAEYFIELFLSDELEQSALSSPYLLDVIECALHALNRMISPILHILRFQHLRKGPLTLLRYETIFSHLIEFSIYHADCKLLSIAIASATTPI